MLRVKGHALLITTVIHFLLTASPQIVGPHTLKKATRHLEEQRVSGGLDVNTLRGAVRSIGILHGIYPLHIAGEGDPQVGSQPLNLTRQIVQKFCPCKNYCLWPSPLKHSLLNYDLKHKD